MRALITGGFGFVGRHLAIHLAQCGDDVALTYLPGSSVAQEESKPSNGVQIPRTAQSFALDVSDRSSVEQIIQLTQPDVVYHLAAISHVVAAEEGERAAFDVNTWGTINLLESIAAHSPHTRFLYVSSSEVYGDPIPGTLPLTELSPPRPVGTYGLSKAAADLAVFKFAYRNGVHAVRVRPFPHTGPGQSDSFALSSFAKQLAEIHLGRRAPEVRVGNLEAKRDYSDVSDIVRGYREAILNGKKSEVYNLCSGKSRSIGDLLQELITVSGVQCEVITEEERLRPVDIADSYGSFDKALRDFGWKPRIDQKTTLHTLYGHWLERLA